MGLKQRTQTPGTRDQQRLEWVLREARKHYRQGMTALELGPGDGTFPPHFRAIGYNVMSAGGPDPGGDWDHFAIDLQVEILPVTFDFVHIGQVLEHVDDDAAALANACQMTRPGGLIIVSVPNFKDLTHVRTYSQASFDRLWAGKITELSVRV